MNAGNVSFSIYIDEALADLIPDGVNNDALKVMMPDGRLILVNYQALQLNLVLYDKNGMYLIDLPTKRLDNIYDINPETQKLIINGNEPLALSCALNTIYLNEAAYATVGFVAY